jgi:hypothetical protein
MTVEEFKATLAQLIDDQTDLTSNEVFMEAQMECADLAEQLGDALITADDAFCCAYVLATYLRWDGDGGVGPASELPIPERTAF